MKYSIVIPHLSNSKYIDKCIEYIKLNSLYENEIITIVDEKDVYYAFNQGVYNSNCDTIVLLSDDMIVSKHWDKYIPFYSTQNTILTGYVVEPNPGVMIGGPSCIKFDAGDNIEDFDYDEFQEFVNQAKVSDIIFNSKGWYMPIVVNKKSFTTYPNINKFPASSNDILLIDQIMPFVGFNFAQIDMFVYHFQRKATLQNNIKKRCIFSYSNHQVEKKIQHFQQKIVEKFNSIPNCKYEYLMYNANDGDMVPDQVIDYAFNKLFYEDKYESILMLDIDCVPLSNHAIEYMFEQAEKGILIGNIQRSNHIKNNKHVYVAPSAICLTRDMYEKLGKISFSPTNRSDIGEEYTWIAEAKNVEIEFFMPKEYEMLPYGESGPWALADGMPKYGIGTTFVNKNNEPMTYHLFQTRLTIFNELFYNKCKQLIL